MTLSNFAYPGILYPKGATYTQTHGVVPDRIQCRFLPQTANVAASGDAQFLFGTEALDIPGCLADKGSEYIDANGYIDSIVLLDRRWKWERVYPVSYHWNEHNADGALVLSTAKSLRDMMTQLLADMGEPIIDVAAVPGNFYPEVDAQCIPPRDLLQQLCVEYGFVVCLGFGTDPVKVAQLGFGVSLPAGDAVMSAGAGIDPPTPPHTVSVCFGPSEAQARFRLVAVGLDTDRVVRPIGQLSYAPAAGWPTGEGLGMENVRAEFGDVAYDYARRTVYRWYIIDTFASGTLAVPDGSGTLADITQVLPLRPTMVQMETMDGWKPNSSQMIVYGKYSIVENGFPRDSDVNNPVPQKFEVDVNRGLVMFSEDAVYLVTGTGSILPAELYLEAGFRIRSATTFQFVSYRKDIIYDAMGFGIHGIRWPQEHARTVVLYGTGHAASGTLTNQAQLDSDAALLASSIAGQYTYKTREQRWYNRPMFNIRLDGLITQLKLHVTDGDDSHGSYSVAATAMEVDPYVRTAFEKSRDQHSAQAQLEQSSRQVLLTRGDKGNE